MSTPAERLLAAADLLDKRASEAVWDQLYAGQSNYIPHIQTRRYTATMHPEVGKRQAALLRAMFQLANAAPHTRDLIVYSEAVALADLVLAGEQEQARG